MMQDMLFHKKMVGLLNIVLHINFVKKYSLGNMKSKPEDWYSYYNQQHTISIF